ncbi:MAG: type II toxin-antitoxin system HicA family toxin [Patescibacteria group bacterium]
MTLPELRGLTAREMARALERDGFRLITTVGSHRVFAHTDGRKVVVAFHAAGATFASGTLHAMLKRTGWEVSDLIRLGLVRRRAIRSRDGREAA